MDGGIGLIIYTCRLYIGSRDKQGKRERSNQMRTRNIGRGDRT